jgi:hypothetical protein
MLTIHVDDLLATGSTSVLDALEKILKDEFGGLTFDRIAFRHFGVDISQDMESFEVRASQEAYIAELKPITLPTRFNKTHPIPSEMITEFRSLVSGMAWVSVTSPQAMSSASLFQGFLPAPLYEHVLMLNANLAQLKATYVCLTYKAIEKPHRILDIADSSFANAAKYSQGGFLVMITHASQECLCGSFVLIDWRSAKSKRVATSTMHSEALAMIGNLESSTFVQSYMLELARPELTGIQLLEPQNFEEMVGIIQCTDCNDLYDTVSAAAQPPSGASKHLQLYIAAVREYKTLGRLRHLCWIDTRDMVANCLTKLEVSGEVPLEKLNIIIRDGCWTLSHPYQWDKVWCYE